MNITQFSNEYKDKSGSNPVIAGIKVFTFVKSIPLQIAKAIAIAIGLLIVGVGILFLIKTSWFLIVVGIIGGILGTIFLSVSGSGKFIASSFIDNLTELFTEMLHPLENMFELWKKSGDENYSKPEFFKKMFKEVILPEVKGMVMFIPFKGKLLKSLNSVVAKVVADKSVNKADEEEEHSEVFLMKLSGIIRKNGAKVKRTSGRPFKFILIFNLIFWLGLISLKLYSLVQF